MGQIQLRVGSFNGVADFSDYSSTASEGSFRERVAHSRQGPVYPTFHSETFSSQCKSVCAAVKPELYSQQQRKKMRDNAFS
jgi:hypothetical protein